MIMILCCIVYYVACTSVVAIEADPKAYFEDEKYKEETRKLKDKYFYIGLAGLIIIDLITRR